jgi:hypothetical protein
VFLDRKWTLIESRSVMIYLLVRSMESFADARMRWDARLLGICGVLVGAGCPSHDDVEPPGAILDYANIFSSCVPARKGS